MSFEKLIRIPNDRIGSLIGKSGNVKSSIEKSCYVTLDVDGDGERRALTDGLLLIRYLFGFSGESLVSGALALGATRRDARAIADYLEARSPSIQKDG